MMKVLIVDDSPIYLMGFKMAMAANPAISTVVSAKSALEALETLEKDGEIGAAVVDVQLSSEDDGLGLVKEIVDRFPNVATMVLSHHKKPNYIYRAIRYGARAYLAKDSSPEEVMNAVADIYAGDCIFFGDTIPRSTLLRLFGNMDNLDRKVPYSLSAQEINVLQKITSGMSNSEIAASIGISSSTVETYKDRIKSKLGFDSIVECVAFAVSSGIVSVR